MTTAFCPGHVTCFFCPVRSYDALSAGSRGVGIKLSKGATVTLEERSDSKVEMTMDGAAAECGITRRVLDMLSPRKGFDVTITNDLPVGQGFGMSAAGALAAALCSCEMSGRSELDAFHAAHVAEVEGGGGLGDVSGILCNSYVPIRVVAGLPPFGKVVNSGLKTNINLAVLGDPLNTGDALGDPTVSKKIVSCGSKAVDEFIREPSVKKLFSLSREFSAGIGLETQEIKNALSKISVVGNVGMCMLGHSIFSTVPADGMRDILGDIDVIDCASTNELPKIIHKA